LLATPADSSKPAKYLLPCIPALRATPLQPRKLFPQHFPESTRAFAHFSRSGEMRADSLLTPNQMTILGGIVLAAGYALMAVVREPQIFLLVAALAGAAWTVSASELWVAGQRVIPDWIRGRMNATHMMVSQGRLSLAGILWGVLATRLGPQWALLLASGLGIPEESAKSRLKPASFDTDS